MPKPTMDHASPARRDEGGAPRGAGAVGVALRAWDTAFLGLILVVLACVGFLGFGSYRSAHDLEKLKRNAEQVAGRLAAVGATRAGAADPGACARKGRAEGGAAWGECFAAIREAPDVAAIANVLVPSNPPFARACSTADPAARGAIVFEKGAEWFSAGSTGTTYGPLGEADEIDREVLLRVRVCGRWGEPITVRDVRF
jgi:hypothetical protein